MRLGFSPFRRSDEPPAQFRGQVRPGAHFHSTFGVGCGCSSRGPGRAWPVLAELAEHGRPFDHGQRSRSRRSITAREGSWPTWRGPWPTSALLAGPGRARPPGRPRPALGDRSPRAVPVLALARVLADLDYGSGCHARLASLSSARSTTAAAPGSAGSARTAPGPARSTAASSPSPSAARMPGQLASIRLGQDASSPRSARPGPRPARPGAPRRPPARPGAPRRPAARVAMLGSPPSAPPGAPRRPPARPGPRPARPGRQLASIGSARSTTAGRHGPGAPRRPPARPGPRPARPGAPRPDIRPTKLAEPGRRARLGRLGLDRARLGQEHSARTPGQLAEPERGPDARRPGPSASSPRSGSARSTTAAASSVSSPEARARDSQRRCRSPAPRRPGPRHGGF